MSGLLGPVVAPGITPDSGQGQLATAISTFFGAGTPQFSTQAPQAAPPPDNTYDKWGHVVTGQPQPQAAAPTVPSLNVGPPGLATGLLAPAAAPGAITPGASGYDRFGRQAPAAPQQAPQMPQLPGLGDIAKMVQDYQAQQQAQAETRRLNEYYGGMQGTG